MNNNTKIEVLKTIIEDTRKDAENFDGRPFNGRNVAKYFGYQGAAIAALATIVKSIVEDEQNKTPTSINEYRPKKEVSEEG